jgi:hypothetical protein
MDTFLDTYDLTKLNEESTDNLNRSIISNEIEIVIKPFSKEKPRTGWIHC